MPSMWPCSNLKITMAEISRPLRRAKIRAMKPREVCELVDSARKHRQYRALDEKRRRAPFDAVATTASASAGAFCAGDREVDFGETIIIARNGVPVAQLRPLERELLEDAKRSRAIGQRVPKRNRAQQYWPLNGTSFPDIPQ